MYTSLLSVSGNASSQGKICSDEICSGKINIPHKIILIHSINNTYPSITYVGNAKSFSIYCIMMLYRNWISIDSIEKNELGE